MGQDFGSFGAVVCFVVFCVCGCGVVCFWGFWLVKLLKLLIYTSEVNVYIYIYNSS
jgi:hypothetical protein